MDTLPGGEYEVTGRYGGDGTFAGSTSPAETLTVTPEKSNINFSGVGESVPYNAPLTLYIQPTGVSAAAGKTDGIATGTATFTVDSTSATVALNSSGVANWNPPALSVGSHTASASYSGNASFSAATAMPVTFTVTKGQVYITGNFFGVMEGIPGTENLALAPGSSLTIGVIVQGWNTIGASPSQIPLGTTAPSGTVQICLTPQGNIGAGACNLPTYSQTVTLTSFTGSNAMESLGTATFTNLAPGQYGSYFVEFEYNGDSVWAPYGLIYISPMFFIQPLPVLASTTTTLSITPTSFSGIQTATVTATVTGSGNAGTSPTGDIDFYDDDVYVTSWQYSGVAGTTSTISFDLTPSWFFNSGANQLTAMYWGDSANGPSVSNVVNLTATQFAVADFTLAPQLPQIAVQSGSSGTVGLNLQSLSSFNGSVALTCVPSSTQFSCSLNPATVTVNGAATATLTVNATVQTASLAPSQGPRQSRWPVGPAMLAFTFLLAGGRAVSSGGRCCSRSAFLLQCWLPVAAAGGPRPRLLSLRRTERRAAPTVCS